MIESISKKLGIEAWRIKSAIERGIIQIYDKPFKHMIFRRGISRIEEGTVVNLENGDIIRGYPKIRRVLFLKQVIRKHFKERIAVEEKMNGYNIRIYLYDGKLYAITRGGFICPYTTYMIRDMKNITRFLSDFNNFILCCEAIGMNNPYIAKEYPEERSFGIFVFDIREKFTNNPIEVEKKYKLLNEYNIRSVRLFGIYKKEEAYENILKIVNELDKEGREGIVLKDPDMKVEPVKYTTTAANIETIRKGFEFPFDFAQGYMNRIIAEAFKCFELNFNEEKIREIAKRIGESILIPFVNSIKKVYNKGFLSEKFELKNLEEDIASELIEFLRKQGIPIMVKKDENKYIIEKIYNTSYNKIRNILKEGFYD